MIAVSSFQGWGLGAKVLVLVGTQVPIFRIVLVTRTYQSTHVLILVTLEKCIYEYLRVALTQFTAKYLSVPASSAPVERFNTAGNVFVPNRCNMTDATFECLMFKLCNMVR